MSVSVYQKEESSTAGHWVTLFTNSKAAMILVECDEVERRSCHGYRQAGGVKLRTLDTGLSRWMI